MNRIILSLCLVLIALMGIAGVSACDVDNCTAIDIGQYDVDEYAVEISPANGTGPFDVEDYGADNSSADGALPSDLEDYGTDDSSANVTAQFDVEDYIAVNSSEDDEFPYAEYLDEYCIDNCPADGITPYNVYEHVHFDENYEPLMDHELYEYAAEVVYYFNIDGAVEIFMHELGISEYDACWLYCWVIEYIHIVEEIAPPDEYDPSMYA